jgi:hypothetical protein
MFPASYFLFSKSGVATATRGKIGRGLDAGQSRFQKNGALFQVSFEKISSGIVKMAQPDRTEWAFERSPTRNPLVSGMGNIV